MLPANAENDWYGESPAPVGPERQDLPPRLLHRRERLDPAVRGRAEVADAERAGQAGRVQQDAGRTR